MNWLKKLVIWAFLQKEIAALEARLSEASTALDKVEGVVVTVAKDASADAQALGEKVLTEVLASADKIRSAAAPVEQEWAKKLYAAYEAAKNDATSVYQKAVSLLEKTVVFVKSKV